MKTKRSVLITLIVTAMLFLNVGWSSTSAFSADSQIQNSILYVKSGADGTTCTSWADPCELNPALHWAAPGNQIWVAAGTYKPTPTGDANRSYSFQLKSGVAVYGGFSDTGDPTWEQRDWEANETILSGDIGIEGDDTDNSYQVVTARIVDDSAILDGFTITGGKADGTQPIDSGGGMYNYQSNPTLTNLIFANNFAQSGGGMFNDLSNPTLTNVSFVGNNGNSGGGMYNTQSNPTLSNVSFTNNSAQGNGGGMYNIASSPSLSFVEFSLNNAAVWGGGMNNQSSHPVMSQVTFYSNEANYGGGVSNTHSSPTLDYAAFNLNIAIVGGGMLNTGTSNPSISNATFSENFASDVGGGMRNSGSDPLLDNVTFSGNTSVNSGGGMINVSGSHPILNNVLFSGNSATDALGTGGGMSNSESNATLTNVTFSGNSSMDWGGGIYNYWSNLHLTNATFTNNSATFGGGILNFGQVGEPAHLTITNSLLWGNTSDQIYNFGAENIITITYSLLDYPSYSDPTNIIGDPLLGLLADNGGFTLTQALGAGSPAIDAGDPNNCPATDQRGVIRPIDGDGVDGARCDIGAYEAEVMHIDFPIYLPMIVR